jgi:hypothetical protein
MNEGEHSSVIASISKCPSCNGELEKGYAITEAISWDRQKKRSFRGPKYLLSKYPAWTFTTFLALRCDKCKIVVFDYSESGRP